MPVQAAVFFFSGLEGVALGLALFVAGTIDAYILGSLLAPDAPSRDLGNINLVVKSASEPHKVVYGRSLVGGTLVFMDVLDRYYLTDSRYNRNSCSPAFTENRDAGVFLNMAVAIAAHEIDGIEEVFFGDELVFRTNVSTGKIEPVSDKYKNYVEFIGYTGNQTTVDSFIKANVDKHYEGGSASAATNAEYYKPFGATAATSTTLTIDSSLVYPTNDALTYSIRYKDASDGDWNTCTGTYNGVYNLTKSTFNGQAEPAEGRQWGASHKLTNTAYIYLRLRWHPDLFSGIPLVRAVIRGKKVYDPRWILANLTETDQGTWAQNTAYVVDDMIDLGSTQHYICVENHTSINLPYTVEDVFIPDFIKSGYWRHIQSNSVPESWTYSDNWALCIRDYLTSGNFHTRSDIKNTLYGIGVKETEIDEANIIEAANTSDEVVYLRPGSLTVATDSFDSTKELETITVVDTGVDHTDYYVKHELLEVTSAAGIHTSLINAVINLVAAIADIYLPTIEEKISDSLTYIEESSYDGVDTTTIKYRAGTNRTPTSVRLYTRRFTINGVIDTSKSPIGILENLLASGAGKLPFTQGKFLTIPGVYITPTITIGENNLAGPVQVQGSIGSSGLINGVTGTIRNPANNWEDSDFTKQTHPDLVTEDGGYELVQNVSYPFITSSFDAQRLARISLQRSRENVSAILICNLSVAEIPIGEFINVTLDRLGWVSKVFSVTSWTYADGKITLGLREENSVAYDWVDTDLTPITYSPATIFDVSPTLDPITNLVLASGTAQLVQQTDGTIVPRVKVTWTAPEQSFGTYLELDFEINIIDGTGTTESRVAKIALVEEEEYFLENIKEGWKVTTTATIRLDDSNVLIGSTPLTVANHTVIGKTAPPANVTGFSSAIKEDLVVLSWNNNTEIDFKHYEIRVGVSWAAGTFVDITKSTDYIVSGHSIGSFTYWVKAIDTSDIESVTAPSTGISVAGPGTVASITATTLDETIKLSWGEVTGGSFAVAGYELRYGGSAWDTGSTNLAITKATDYTVPGDWTDNRTFRIKSIDAYGNLGVETTKVVNIATPEAPVILSSIIVGDRIEITWSMSTNNGTFSVPSFDIRYDNGTGAFVDATKILITSTDAFSRKVSWVGTRRFWIAPIDSVGNIGTEADNAIATSSVVITAPGATSIIPQVIDNNVLLSWTDTPGTLPVAFYEIRRGDVYASADVVGNISSLFAAIFETISDTYTYWVTGVDTAGNFGTNNSIVAAVNEPPDFTLLVNTSDPFTVIDANWTTRSFDNSFVNSAGNINLPADITQTWATHFTGNSWTTIQNQISAGFPIYIQSTPLTAQYQVVYDHGVVINNLSITCNITSTVVDGDPISTLQIETSDQTVPTVWTSFPTTTANSIKVFATSFRHIRVTLDVISTPVDTGTALGTHSTTTLADTGATFIADGLISNGDFIQNMTNLEIREILSFTETVITTTATWTLPVDGDLYELYLADDDDLIDISNIGLIIDVKEKTDSGTETVSIVTGTNDTLDATGITLEDTTATFLTTAIVGQTVRNVTTGDTAEITSITDDTTIVMSAGLAGGGDNEWGAGDTYSLGTTVNFSVGKNFIDINSINVTVGGGSQAGSITPVYDFADIPNPTRFSVFLFDDTGTEITTGEFSWTARGF